MRRWRWQWWWGVVGRWSSASLVVVVCVGSKVGSATVVRAGCVHPKKEESRANLQDAGLRASPVIGPRPNCSRASVREHKHGSSVEKYHRRNKPAERSSETSFCRGTALQVDVRWLQIQEQTVLYQKKRTRRNQKKKVNRHNYLFAELICW